MPFFILHVIYCVFKIGKLENHLILYIFKSWNSPLMYKGHPLCIRDPLLRENEKLVLSSLDPRGGFSYLILPPGPACFRPTVPLEFRSGTVCHMLRLVSYQSSFNLTNFAGHECRNRPWGTFRQPPGPPHRFRRLMTALRSSSTVSDTRFQVNSSRWPSDRRLTLQLSHLSHQGKVTNSYCPMNSRWIFCLWFHFNLTFSQSLFQQSTCMRTPIITRYHSMLNCSIVPRNVVLMLLNDSQQGDLL